MDRWWVMMMFVAACGGTTRPSSEPGTATEPAASEPPEAASPTIQRQFASPPALGPMVRPVPSPPPAGATALGPRCTRHDECVVSHFGGCCDCCGCNEVYVTTPKELAEDEGFCNTVDCMVCDDGCGTCTVPRWRQNASNFDAVCQAGHCKAVPKPGPPPAQRPNVEGPRSWLPWWRSDPRRG